MGVQTGKDFRYVRNQQVRWLASFSHALEHVSCCYC